MAGATAFDDYMRDTVTFFVQVVARDTEQRKGLVVRLQRLLDESM